MLIYLDMCCLKRPFHDQSQVRIRLETEAVLGLLAMEPGRVTFIRSAALQLENALNPVRERARRVDLWLASAPAWLPEEPQRFSQRVAELIDSGLKNFDALQVASAEGAMADIFATTDDRLLAVARRECARFRTRVCSVIECAQELSR